jgi:hypothetical protein
LQKGRLAEGRGKEEGRREKEEGGRRKKEQVTLEA